MLAARRQLPQVRHPAGRQDAPDGAGRAVAAAQQALHLAAEDETQGRSRQKGQKGAAQPQEQHAGVGQRQGPGLGAHVPEQATQRLHRRRSQRSRGTCSRALEHDPLVHLGGAVHPLHEGERHLHHAEAAAQGPVGHLDLEHVAGAAHRIQVDGTEYAPVKALEAAGEVAHRHLQQRARVQGAELRDQLPSARPVLGAAAGDPARPPAPGRRTAPARACAAGIRADG